MAIWRISTCKTEAGYSSSSSIYNLIRDGLWTKPVQLARRSVGWPDYEVRSICAARIAGHTNAEIKELVGYLHGRRTELLNESLIVIPVESASSASPVLDLNGLKPNKASVRQRTSAKAGGAA